MEIEIIDDPLADLTDVDMVILREQLNAIQSMYESGGELQSKIRKRLDDTLTVEKLNSVLNRLSKIRLG